MDSMRITVTTLLIGLCGSIVQVATVGGQPPGIAPPVRAAQLNNPALPGPAPAIAAATLLERAIAAIETRDSVSASVRQRVNLFGKDLLGSGTYLQSRTQSAPKFRLELKVQLSGETSSVLEVFDGQYIWTKRQFGAKTTLTRIDFVRLEGTLHEHPEVFEAATLRQWPGLGGLPKMLRGLHASFEFTAAEETRLAGLPVPAWKLEGQWRPQVLAHLAPDQQKAIAAGKPIAVDKLPPHLPERVVLFLGKDDLFPYCVEYHRRVPAGLPGLESSLDRIIVRVDFFEVMLGVAIHPNRFAFAPGKLEYTDQTEKLLEGLGVPKK
jgi:hypothetical protein